mgnify:CR=1 FL=1
MGRGAGVKIAEMALALNVPTCTAGCALSKTRHREGVIDGFGIIHFAERRFSRRSAKNYLMLVARLWREGDPEYLNIELFDWQSDAFAPMPFSMNAPCSIVNGKSAAPLLNQISPRLPPIMTAENLASPLGAAAEIGADFLPRLAEAP